MVNIERGIFFLGGGLKERATGPTSKISAACHAIPPAVTSSMPEIPRAPKVSNLPCPDVNRN